MNALETRRLSETLANISNGAKWECLWQTQEGEAWGPPLGLSLHHCLVNSIPIRAIEIAEQPCNCPEITTRTIFELYNALPEEAQNPMMEFPAEDLHELALSHNRLATQLARVSQMLKASEQKSAETREEIDKILNQASS